MTRLNCLICGGSFECDCFSVCNECKRKVEFLTRGESWQSGTTHTSAETRTQGRMNTSERLGIASVGAKALIIALMMCFPLIQTSHASQIPSEVYCIIGEAEGEGYEGMLAVSEAIRNRGSLKGVYGCQASRVKNRLYSQAVLQTANLAWQNSLHTNTVRGATHWEGTAFKTPYWAKDMIVTATIRNQRFYKERGTK